jgi:hypothetical protein
MIILSVIFLLQKQLFSTAHTNRAAYFETNGVGLVCARAQLQRSKQAEGGMRLRDVSREVHGQEYNGFYLGAQPKPYERSALTVRDGF